MQHMSQEVEIKKWSSKLYLSRNMRSCKFSTNTKSFMLNVYRFNLYINKGDFENCSKI